MSTLFIKAVVLTMLVVAQAKIAEFALFFTKEEDLPIGLAVLFSLVTFLLGIYLYNHYLSQTSTKH